MKSRRVTAQCLPAAALARRSRINALGASNYEDWAYFWLDVTMSKTPLRHTIIKSILENLKSAV